MTYGPMGPEVWTGPPASLFVSQGSGFLCALAGLPCRNGLDVPLDFLYDFMHGLYGGIIGRHVVVLFGHLVFQVRVGVSEVGHCRPAFCHHMIKVGKGFLDAHKVVGYVAALA